VTIQLSALVVLGLTLIEPTVSHVQGIDVEGGTLWVTAGRRRGTDLPRETPGT